MLILEWKANANIHRGYKECIDCRKYISPDDWGPYEGELLYSTQHKEVCKDCIPVSIYRNSEAFRSSPEFIAEREAWRHAFLNGLPGPKRVIYPDRESDKKSFVAPNAKSTGKPCKRCSNKGDYCFYHARTEESESDKKSDEDLIELCKNTDCERYPPDWDFEKDTEETYQEGQWQKCNICDGYFDDNGLGDILFVQEEPNNQDTSCDLCGKCKDIVQMKGSGQYVCGNACDESDEDAPS